ncbi:MAG TPA: hypothetical protein VKY31_11165 [Terriglobia bacterium]|nr:hypothetical protein [Terriglobia bacterium]
MLRPLFQSELKRTLPSNLGLGLAVVVLVRAAVMVASRFGAEALSEAEYTGFGVGIFLIFVGAFLFGAKAFGPLKDNHSSFLMSLPASRRLQWGVIVSANFAEAAGISVFIYFLLPPRPPDFHITFQTVAELMLAYLALFFLGCCSILAFRKAAFVAVAGILAFVGFAVSTAALEEVLLAGVANVFVFPLMLSLIVSICAIVSLRAFVRAEFFDLRVRIKTIFALCGSFLTCFLILLAVIDSSLPAKLGTWQMMAVDSGFFVSPDGKHVAILRQNDEFPVYKRLDIIDVASGGFSQGPVDYDLKLPIWTTDGTILNIVSSRILTGSDYIIQVSPRGEVIQKTRAPVLIRLWSLIAKSGADVWMEGLLTRQFPNYHTAALLKAHDKSGGIHVERWLEFDDYVPQERRRLGEEFPPPRPPREGTLVAYIWCNLCPPQSSPGMFLWGDASRKSGTLLSFIPRSGWKVVAEDILLGDGGIAQMHRANGLMYGSRVPFDLAFDSTLNVVAYRKEQAGRLYIYDVASQTTSTFEAAGETHPAALAVRAAYGNDSRFISFSDRAGVLYSPGRNTLKRIDLHSIASPPFGRLLWVDESGNHIVSTSNNQLFYFSADGMTRRLWPIDGARP